jgi:hypothetical protein
MKKYLIGLIMTGIVFCTLAFQVQKKPVEKKKIVHKGKTYLFNGMGSGKISKKMFDSLINYNLIARDSQNREHPVIQFTFTYAERGAYEDTTGKLRIMTDYNSIESEQGKLPDFWTRNLKERSKAGDTAIFSEVLSTYQDSLRTRFYAEPLKLIITD